jgi:cell division protein FtsW (lipid II flippase)
VDGSTQPSYRIAEISHAKRMGFIVVILTMLVLTVYGTGLNWLWNAGFWYITAAAFPITMLIAYAFSPPADRDEFKAWVRSFFRFRR